MVATSHFPTWLLVLSFYTRRIWTSDPLSIQSEPVFITQRGCIRDCLYCGEYWLANCDGTPLAEAIGCYDDQYHNCYCATDLQSSASSYITKCINSACSGDQADVTSAMSLYNGYCKIGTWELGSSYVPMPSLTIQSQPAFMTQRECVRDCLYCGEYWEANCAFNPLADAIGCYDDQYDNCYCATDLQSTASAFISRCVNSACCGDQADVSIAMSLYNGYCGIGTWTLSNYPAPTSGSSYQGSLSSSQESSYSASYSANPGSTRTPGPRPTGSGQGGSGGQGSSGSTLSVASITGIVISAVCSVLGLIFGAWWKVRESRREREERLLQEWRRQNRPA